MSTDHQPGTLSVQLWSVRDAFAADRADTLRRLAELGFRFVEPFGLGDLEKTPAQRLKEAGELRELLHGHGMQVSGVHLNAGVGEQTDAILDEMQALGATEGFLAWPGAIPGMDRETLRSREDTIKLAEIVNETAHKAAGRGLKIGYHNHDFEWTPQDDGQYGYDVLLEQLDPQVTLELDVYWAMVAGRNLPELLKHLGSRVTALHIKDGFETVSEERPQVPLGQGLVDYVAAIRAAPHVRWHVLEMDHSTDIFHDLPVSLKKIREQGLSDWN